MENSVGEGAPCSMDAPDMPWSRSAMDDATLSARPGRSTGTCSRIQGIVIGGNRIRVMHLVAISPGLDIVHEVHCRGQPSLGRATGLMPSVHSSF